MRCSVVSLSLPSLSTASAAASYGASIVYYASSFRAPVELPVSIALSHGRPLDTEHGGVLAGGCGTAGGHVMHFVAACQPRRDYCEAAVWRSMMQWGYTPR